MKRIISMLIGCVIAAAAWASPTASLSWTAPTLNSDGSTITATLTYNVYQAAQGSTLVKVQSALANTGVLISAGLTPGTTQCFAVTAVANGQEGAQSATACAAIPFQTPGVPTQITVVVR